MFAYEQYRKQALGLTLSQQQKISHIDKKEPTSHTETSVIPPPSYRIKRTPRVMRMFQVKK